MITSEKELKLKIKDFLFNSTSKYLSIITVPYKGAEVFRESLEEVKTRKIESRVLIITSEDERTGYFQSLLKDLNINYKQLEQPNPKDEINIIDEINDILSKENTILMGFEETRNLDILMDDYFDFVIYDDINSFPTHEKEDIKNLSKILARISKKVIIYSFEKIIESENEIVYPIKFESGFNTQPRFVLSNANVRKDISNTIYDYIDYFFKNRFKVIIYVPDDDVINGMVSSIKRINPLIINSLYNFDESSPNQMKEILSQDSRSAILFSKKMRDYKEFDVNFQFIVSEAFRKEYNYRQFVFLCARTNMKPDKTGEVLLVSPKITQDMKNCKNITMEFNKFYWDRMDFLKMKENKVKIGEGIKS